MTAPIVFAATWSSIYVGRNQPRGGRPVSFGSRRASLGLVAESGFRQVRPPAAARRAGPGDPRARFELFLPYDHRAYREPPWRDPPARLSSCSMTRQLAQPSASLGDAIAEPLDLSFVLTRATSAVTAIAPPPSRSGLPGVCGDSLPRAEFSCCQPAHRHPRAAPSRSRPTSSSVDSPSRRRRVRCSQIVNLLLRPAGAPRALSYLFIAHDLASSQHLDPRRRIMLRRSRSRPQARDLLRRPPQQSLQTPNPTSPRYPASRFRRTPQRSFILSCSRPFSTSAARAAGFPTPLPRNLMPRLPCGATRVPAIAAATPRPVILRIAPHRLASAANIQSRRGEWTLDCFVAALLAKERRRGLLRRHLDVIASAVIVFQS